MIKKTACIRLSIVVLMTLAPRLTVARIVLDDGGQHLITEELDPEVVSVDNSTKLTLSGSVRMEIATPFNGEIYEGNNGVVDVLSASQLTVDGGQIRASLEFVPHAVFLSESSASINSAELSGGISAKDSQLHVTAGRVVGIQLGDNASMSLESSTANIKSAELVGVIFAENSQLHITAGKVKGFDPNFGVTSSMRLDSTKLIAADAEIEGPVRLMGSSVGQMMGGSMSSGLPDFEAIALSLSDESTFELASGIISASNFDFGAVAVQTAGNARFVMNDGALSTNGMHEITTQGVLSDDNSLVEIHDGSLTVQSLASTLLFAKGSSRMTITGLEAVVRQQPHVLGPQRHVGYRATENAHIEISGGSMSGEEPFLEVLAEDEGTVTIVGSDFNYPLFNSIQDTTGTITGRLRDGNEFSWDFERDPTATIVLVPEPTGVSMLGWAVISLVVLLRVGAMSSV